MQLPCTGAQGDMLEDLDLNSIADDRARDLVQQLFNRLEDVMADLQVAQEEIQRLRNEIARLKREQGHGFLIKILPASATPQTCWGSQRSLRALPENSSH